MLFSCVSNDITECGLFFHTLLLLSLPQDFKKTFNTARARTLPNQVRICQALCCLCLMFYITANVIMTIVAYFLALCYYE